VQLSEHGILEVVLEDLLRVLVRFGVALRGAVHALEARLVVVRLAAQDQGLDGDKDLKLREYTLESLRDDSTGEF
jgi:hypothetical protein